MHAFIRKYLSLFFLALFLFPYVQKGIHDLEHASEVHCTDKSSAHFHELEHTCSICDYTIGKEFTSIDPDEFGFAELSSIFLFPETGTIPFGSDKYSFLLRGPPVLS